MNPILPALLMTILLPPALLADPEHDAALAKIRQLYASVSEAKPTTTRTLKFAVPDDPMEGTITYHSYPDGLSSIMLSYVAGDHGGSDQQFCFGPAGLFFVFESASSWRFGPPAGTGEPTSIDSLREQRFYFRDGRCFHALTREGESAAAKDVQAIVSKLPNKVFEPGAEARALFKRALALRGMTTAKEAAAYFLAEGEAP